MLRTKIAAAGFAAALAIGLTACGGEQSVADACKVANESVAKAQSDITTAMSEAGSGDFSKVTAGIKKVADAIGEAEGKVTNKEVKASLGEMKGSFTKFNALFDGVKDGDLAALADKSTEMQNISKEMTDSANKFTTLCAAK